MPQFNANLSGPRVNYNAAASINVNRLNRLEKGLMRSMEHISSGVRITRPADDVADHSVSEKLRGQIRGMSAASRNIQDGIALVNVAEGALNEVNDMLNRIRELSTQAANGTMTDVDRQNIGMEINKLKEEIDYISDSAQYNGKSLLNGTGEWGHRSGGNLQINADNLYNTDYIRYTVPIINTRTLGIDGDNLLVDSQETAGASIDIAKEAVNRVNAVRADLGAIASRLEQAWKNIDKITEDNQSYESVIRDTDVAEEMISVTRDQIISQYCNAMLAQANQTPQSILQLLSR